MRLGSPCYLDIILGHETRKILTEQIDSSGVYTLYIRASWHYSTVVDRVETPFETIFFFSRTGNLKQNPFLLLSAYTNMLLKL